MSDKYAAITAHADRYAIQLMCAALEVSSSGYYAAVQRVTAPPTERAAAQARRRLVVRAMFLRCHRRYGAPRLVHELRAAGEQIAQKSVAKILRQDGVAARRPTPFVCTTDSAHVEPIVENLLALASRLGGECVARHGAAAQRLAARPGVAAASRWLCRITRIVAVSTPVTTTARSSRHTTSCKA